MNTPVMYCAKALAALALLLIATPDSFALGDRAVDAAGDRTELSTELSTGLSNALDALDDERENRFTLGGAILDLQRRIEASPDAEALRRRVMPLLDQLNDRAQFAYIQAQELAVLREAIVSARLDRALGLLQGRAIGGGWSRDQLAEVTMAWMSRAEVFIDAPDPLAYRARVMASMEMAMMRSGDILESVRDMRVQLLLLHLEFSKQRLARAVMEGQLSEVDYHDQIAAQIARARAIYLSELRR